MNLKEMLKAVHNLNFPQGECVVVGSGTLTARGIRESLDVDLIVSEKIWNELSKKHDVFQKGGVNRISLSEDVEVLGPGSIFLSSAVIPVENVFNEAEVYEEIKFLNLQHLKKFKRALGRDKDLEDVQLIEAYESKS